METFRPSVTEYLAGENKTAILICPGGAYRGKAEHEGPVIAQRFNASGFNAFVLDYRICPCDRRAPLNDALRAVRLIRSIGYDKVIILGFSAGGHLACCAAVHPEDAELDPADPVDSLSSKPDGLISCYSVISMLEHAHEGSVRNLLGTDCESKTLRSYYSVQLHVSADTPSAFIWHTSGDGSVPVENSLMLASSYAKAGVPFELHVFPGGYHGMGLAEKDPVISQWFPLCMMWIAGSHLR